ncbi:MAG: peptidoglycan DD-metalloendopeptidase family protein [Leptospira sp.]|nr:peptidoglycan DD-metalloendopeptidase family protein [Leptospira sp.]
MKRSCIALLFLFSIGSIHPQSNLDDKSKDLQNALLEKNKASRERILAKYDQFYNRIKNRYPGLDFKSLPMDPSLAKDVIDHNEAPGGNSKKVKQVFGYAAENFYLKSEPDPHTNFNLPTKLKRGEKVEIVMVLKNDGPNRKESSNWCLIRTSSKKEGYVPSEYLSPSNSSATLPKNRNIEPNFFDPTTGSSPELDGRHKGKTYWVSASILNLRANPDVNSFILDRISRGTKVTIVQSTMKEDQIDDKSDVWHEVESGFQKGWVFGGYLSSSEITVTYDGNESAGPSFPSENPDDLKPGEKRYVRSATLRLRDEPNDYGTVITTIPGAERVKIIDSAKELETIGGIRSRWIYVSWDDTWEGWVFGGFVSKEKGELVDNDDISKYFQLPVDNDRYVSSSFGTRVDPVTGKIGAFHSGIDLPAATGTPIRAVSDGKVWKTVTTSGGYGVLTILSHKNNIYTYYAHQNDRKVAEGESVKSGDIIGEVGNTGKSTGPHLHFEVRKGPSQQALDPGAYLPK